MDTSDEYIKMRVGAIPDLGYGEPLESTFRSEQYYISDNEEYSVFVASNGNWHAFHPDIPANGEQGRTCQLERQDQLREMFGDYGSRQLIQRFHRFACSVSCDELAYAEQFTSMEQLWLGFVMKELHSKTWDRDKWV